MPTGYAPVRSLIIGGGLQRVLEHAAIHTVTADCCSVDAGRFGHMKMYGDFFAVSEPVEVFPGVMPRAARAGRKGLGDWYASLSPS